MCLFFFKQKTAYEMRISDWSSDVCSSDLPGHPGGPGLWPGGKPRRHPDGVHHPQCPACPIGWRLPPIFEEMNYTRHETAIVDDGAQIGEGSRVWHFVHVCAGARIGAGVSLGQNVFVANKVDRKSTRLNHSH